MMLFQRRLFTELLWNTLTTVALLTLVIMLIIAAQLVQSVPGLTLLSFGRMMPVLVATQLDITLPMSVLVAVVLTYGRAAADNEVDTLRASGVHPAHLIMPGLVFGALMMLVLLGCMDYAKPLAETAKRRLTKDADFRGILHDKLTSGEPAELSEGTVISAEGFDEDGNALGMRVQLFSEEGILEHEYLARSAEVKVNNEAAQIEMHLYGVRAVKGPRFDSEDMLISRPLPKELAQLGAENLTTPQLMAYIQRPVNQRIGIPGDRAQLAVDMRLASAAACVLFVMLGLPVALLFRRHDRTAAFLVAFLVALFVYYPAREITRVLSDRDVLSPTAASWSGNAFILLVSLLLAWRVFRR